MAWKYPISLGISIRGVQTVFPKHFSYSRPLTYIRAICCLLSVSAGHPLPSQWLLIGLVRVGLDLPVILCYRSHFTQTAVETFIEGSSDIITNTITISTIHFWSKIPIPIGPIILARDGFPIAGNWPLKWGLSDWIHYDANWGCCWISPSDIRCCGVCKWVLLCLPHGCSGGWWRPV